MSEYDKKLRAASGFTIVFSSPEGLTEDLTAAQHTGICVRGELLSITQQT